MNNLKALHITSWYPSALNQVEGIFIQEHIKSLSQKGDNTLFHFQIKKGKNPRVFVKKISKSERQLIIVTPIFSWKLNEVLHFFYLSMLFCFLRVNKRYDAVNFHIAYPMLTYFHLLRSWIKVPVFLTEHWSAYHFNFNLSSEKNLNRIRNIFKNQLTLITVSQALGRDIKTFSKRENLDIKVVPNAVSDEFVTEFPSEASSSEELIFFAAAVWKPIKKPMILLNAFNRLLKLYPNAIFNIAGPGDQVESMRDYIMDNKLEQNVKLLGALNKEQMAYQMMNSTVFLHCSSFETFSVVCAESICSGTPVIASRIDAIAEFINSSNGILVPENEVADWYSSMKYYIDNKNSFNRDVIRDNAISKFSSNAVGEKYISVLKGN